MHSLCIYGVRRSYPAFTLYSPGIQDQANQNISVGTMVQRRDFLYYATGAVAAGVTGTAIWGLGRAMGPTAATQHDKNLYVDISDLEEGRQLTVKFRQRPVFIRHRTQEEVDQARATQLEDLFDTATRSISSDRHWRHTVTGSADDRERSVDPEGRYIVLWGICTKEGCVPLGDRSGDYYGWFCPCCGTHYDTSGRFRKGPAPHNMYIPNYEWDAETMTVALIDETSPLPLSDKELDRILYGDVSENQR